MAKTSARAKNDYAAAAYDRITFIVKKGEKDIIQGVARSKNVSVSRYIVDAINAYEGAETLTILDDESKKKKPAEKL